MGNLKISDEEYAAEFAVIRRICNESEILPAWFGREVAPAFDTAGPTRVLSVGAGPGEMDERLLGHLPKSTQIEYTAVEPSSAFTNRVLARRDPRVRGEVVNTSFEEAPLLGPYDLILACHSLYYMKDRAGVLARAVDHLTPRTGRLLLVHQAWNGVAQIQRHFVTRYALPTNPGPPAELLLDVMDELASRTGLRFRYEVVNTTIETSSILDERSGDAVSLYRFLLDAEPDRAGLAEFRAFVADLSYPHAGRRWMMQPLGAIIASRT